MHGVRLLQFSNYVSTNCSAFSRFCCCFFYTLELRGLRDPQQVECYQDQAQIMLGDYIRRHFPGQQVRFGKLLLMLPSLRMVNPKTIEELFFRQTIGSVAIESLLCDMFKSS